MTPPDVGDWVTAGVLVVVLLLLAWFVLRVAVRRAGKGPRL